MKIKILILGLIFILGLVFGIFKIVNYNKIEYDIRYIEQPIKDTINICVLDDQYNLVVIELEIEDIENKEYYILELYDIYRNSLPINFFTPVKSNYNIESINCINNEITIKINDFIGDKDKFIYSIYITFKLLGYDKINLIIDNNYQIIKKIDVIYEDDDLSKAIYQIVYYHNNDNLIPVTYLHNSKEIDFLINKLYSNYINDINYYYVEDENNVYIYIEDNKYLLNNKDTDLLLFNLNQINSNVTYTIIKNQVVLKNN